MSSFHDHASLILHLGGAAGLAAGISTHAVNVRAWVARNRIPPEYWPSVITYAASVGDAVSADWLMHTTPARRRAERAAA
ncbi:hypothetical protein [Sphingomonas hankookensis]|uniref:hypothetical protein n=1 Tax=Sphingomonas hankookensis TaxID=563996 RepID=UPI0018DD9B00|nr:hypothetical protein [Sphingomonas hankookensis]